MVKIRLTRLGKKGQPFYRIVAIPSQRKRGGAFLEILGFYNPLKNPAEVKINQDRYLHWISRGAQPSQTVANLVKKSKLA